MRGLSEGISARDEGDVPATVFEGPARLPAIGVLTGGLGSDAVEQALRESGRRVGVVHGVTTAAIADCDVLVVTERRTPASLTKRNCWLIWDWVERGGRLLLTHDAVGYRDHPILFPWVCTGGTAHVAHRSVRVVWAPAGREPLGEVTHGYPDHILLRPCLRATVTVIAVDDEWGEPVVSGAAFEHGRVVACGLALGVAPDRSESLPSGGERELLNVMLDWLLGEP
jgi:hypothetical protein